MENYLEIGKIVKVHGVKGEIKAINLSDYQERFSELDWAFINFGDKRLVFYFENVRYFKNVIIIKFKGIDDANSAQTLVNKYIEVDRENAIELPDHAYFICDIIGCKVWDDEKGFIGEIIEVMDTGSNDVYVVKMKNGSEALIPALKSVVINVDIQNSLMKVRLPKGLLEDEI